MSNFATPAELPARIRIFPLAGALLLPRAQLPLNIFEPRYVAMVRDAMASDQLIGMIQPSHDSDDPPPLYDVGCLGRITQFSETGDGRLLITLSGLIRFRVTDELPAGTPYRQILANFAPYHADWTTGSPLSAPERASLEDALTRYLDVQGLAADWDSVRGADDESLVSTLSAACPFLPAERQALLEAPDLSARTDTLVALMGFAGEGGHA